MKEEFQPISNVSPDTLYNKLKFYGRMVLDFQILTIFLHIRKVVPNFSGNVLDIGCGQSPYRFLLSENTTRYYGIDVKEAADFGYNNPDITYFDGEVIPFNDEMFSGIICTEVLEHVFHFEKLIAEIYRVMKKDAKAIITIPWSARFHYIPHDYFRYTPSALKNMFSGFENVEIVERGSDISNIGNKVVVLFFRNLLPNDLTGFLFWPLWILLLPILLFIVVLSQISIWLKLGSKIDPLGYTIILKK